MKLWYRLLEIFEIDFEILEILEIIEIFEITEIKLNFWKYLKLFLEIEIVVHNFSQWLSPRRSTMHTKKLAEVTRP